MSQQHICYYSARCRYCQSFLEELSRSPYNKEFRFICVDAGQNNQKPKIPANIKAVPTLVIAGEAEPRTDGAVMNWLSERRLQERHTPGPSSGGAAGPSSGLASHDMQGPVGFEDSFGSEGYAFIGEDTNATSGAIVRLTGSMAGINELTSMTAPTMRGFDQPTQAAPVQKTSAKSKALDDAFAAYQAKRDLDMGSMGPGMQRR